MKARQDRILARQCPNSRRIRRAGNESIDGDRFAFHLARVVTATVTTVWFGSRASETLAMP
jgi:hypothetical protein